MCFSFVLSRLAPIVQVARRGVRAGRARLRRGRVGEESAPEIIARAVAQQLQRERDLRGVAEPDARRNAVEYAVRSHYVLAGRVPPPNLLDLIDAALRRLEQAQGSRLASRSRTAR